MLSSLEPPDTWKWKGEVTSDLGDNCHKVCGRGLIVQSFTGFHSQDAAVTVDGELGQRWCLREHTLLVMTGINHWYTLHFMYITIMYIKGIFKVKCLTCVTNSLLSSSACVTFWNIYAGNTQLEKSTLVMSQRALNGHVCSQVLTPPSDTTLILVPSQTYGRSNNHWLQQKQCIWQGAVNTGLNNP